MADPSFIDAGVKFAHHAHDHHSEMGGHTGDLYTDMPDLKNKGMINANDYAWSKATSAAFTGASILALFGTLYLGLKIAAHYLIETSLTAAMGEATAAIITGALSAALTGAIWYGGKTYLQARSAANEHNETLTQRIRNGLGISKEREREPEQTINMGAGRFIPELDGSSAAASGPFSNEPSQATLASLEATPQSRPAFLSNILEKGPKSISPADIAARMAEERAANMDTARS